jgi:hypothetical protein
MSWASEQLWPPRFRWSRIALFAQQPLRLAIGKAA